MGNRAEWCKARGAAGERARKREREREVGEQYLGDFALYLEMSFVGSISSTIRTLSLCPGVYRGVGSIRVYLCLQIDTRRTWVHPLARPPIPAARPPRAPFLPFLFTSLFCLPHPFLLILHPCRAARLPRSLCTRRRATQLCTNRIVATSISR